MPTILEHGTLRQGNRNELEASLSYTVSLRKCGLHSETVFNCVLKQVKPITKANKHCCFILSLILIYNNYKW